MAANQRTVVHFDIVAGATALQEQMTIARRNQGLAANHRFTVHGLLHGNLADLVEALRESRREVLRSQTELSTCADRSPR